MTITPIQSTERAPIIASATATQATQPDAAKQQEQQLPTTGYYFSPVLKIDPQTQAVVIQYRNSETGAVTNQYPSEKELKAYASQQKFNTVGEDAAAGKTAAPTDAVSQPAATAVISTAAVKPASTFNTATTTAPAPTKASIAPAAPETGSSLLI